MFWETWWVMRHELTPASERALEEAAHWSRAPGGSQGASPARREIGLPELLMGLLSQTECRAASMLAARGIDRRAVRRRWPDLVRLDTPAPRRPDDPVSPALRGSFQAVEERMFAYPRPVALATEHLLLGMLAVADDISEWLGGHGFDADELESEIHRMHGHSPEPLPYEPLDQTIEDRPNNTEFNDSTVAGEKPAAGAPTSDAQVYRILDAAANRATEALRVIEDYVRFALDDRHLTSVCKQMRHRLVDVLSGVRPGLTLACRDTRRDVGTELSAESERTRADLASVVAANCSRLQESLRSLEEYGKLINPELGEAVKQIRYESYTLQRAVETTRRSLERLADARLYVLVDGREGPHEFEPLVRSLVDCGVHIIQLRDKRLADRELLERARLLRRVTRASSTLFIMNDRADLAVLADADGVHVGQDELPMKDVRSVVGPEMLVGVSTHSLEQARRAVLDGADYIGVGPAFPSRTKQFAEFVGVELLEAVAREIRLPAFAIGGIDRGNVGLVLEAGIDRVAMSGAILGSEDPVAIARELVDILGRSRKAATSPDVEERLSEGTPQP